MTQAELIDALKPLVEATSARELLLAFARMCNERAEDARIYEQSRLNERDWNALAERIDNAAEWAHRI